MPAVPADAMHAAQLPGPQRDAAQQQQQRQEASHQGGADQQTPKPTDCMSCRLTGLALGVGGGGYIAARLFEQPYPKGAHRYALIGTSVGLFALGVGRALGS
jgi:hypothetical protein